MTALRAAALLIAAAPLAAASPALAQSNPVEPGSPVPATPEPAVESRDSITIGAGVGYLPDYEGSDDYRFIPAAQARGQISGISFFTRGLSLYVDLIPQGEGETVDFALGPLVALNLGRSTDEDGIEDDAVRALGRVDTSVEIGGFAGISKTGVITSDYDTLSARVSYRQDVAGGHDSYVLAPQIDYLTPLSRTTILGLSGSLEFVGDDYARSFFGVTPLQSTASGFAVYNPEGGLKSYSLALFAGQSLEGDIREGFSLFGTVVRTKLVGDFADSPLVTVDGDSTQWLFAVGIGYTF